MADEDAPVYKYRNKLGLTKDELAYNIKILDVHRQYVKTADEMNALKAKMAEEVKEPPKPIESLEEKLNRKIAEMKKDMGNGCV